MNSELIDRLKPISEEEQRILDGDYTVQKSLYTDNLQFVIESDKMLAMGKLISMRTNTRFIHFPKHRHNYIEIVYMCSGTSLHIINDKTSILLETGDLLFLNQNAYQEIMPTGIDDIAINIMVLPEFFDQTFLMLQEDGVLANFLVGMLKNDQSMVDYLHFSVKDVLPIQNLVENLVWSLFNDQPYKNNINQTTMGLLFLELQNHSHKINQSNTDYYEQNLIFTAMRYIEDHYKTASLQELASILHQPDYWVSKLIKGYTKQTFKQLVQKRRLTQSSYLLLNTKLPVEDIISLVGYDNSSYFHRLFKNEFKMTPKVYRNNARDTRRNRGTLPRHGSP